MFRIFVFMILMPVVVFTQWVKGDGQYINQTNFENIKQFKVDYDSKEIIIVEFDKVYFIDLLSGKVNNEYDLNWLWDLHYEDTHEYFIRSSKINISNDNSKVILTKAKDFNHKLYDVSTYLYDINTKSVLDSNGLKLGINQSTSVEIKYANTDYINNSFIIQLEENVIQQGNGIYGGTYLRTYFSPNLDSLILKSNSATNYIRYNSKSNILVSLIVEERFSQPPIAYSTHSQYFGLQIVDINKNKSNNIYISSSEEISDNDKYADFYEVNGFALSNMDNKATILSDNFLTVLDLEKKQFIDTLLIGNKYNKIEYLPNDRGYLLLNDSLIDIYNINPFHLIKSIKTDFKPNNFRTYCFNNEGYIVNIGDDGKLRKYSSNILVDSLQALFTAKKEKISLDSAVEFVSYSQGEILKYKWDFGDGSVSNKENPVHHYINIGSYDVSLIVDNGKTKDTLIKHNFITILPEIKPEFSLELIDQASNEFKLVNITIGKIDSVTWEIGNGIVTNENSPVIYYDKYDDYGVKLNIYYQGIKRSHKKEFCINTFLQNNIDDNLFDKFRLFSTNKKPRVDKVHIINDSTFMIKYLISKYNMSLREFNFDFITKYSRDFAYSSHFYYELYVPALYLLEYLGDGKLWVNHFPEISIESEKFDLKYTPMHKVNPLDFNYKFQSTFDDWYLFAISDVLLHRSMSEDTTFKFNIILNKSNYYYDKFKNNLLVYSDTVKLYDMKKNLLNEFEAPVNYNLKDLRPYNDNYISILENVNTNQFSLNLISSDQNETIFSDSLMTINKLHYLNTDLLIAQGNIGKENFLILVNKYFDVKKIKIEDSNLEIDLFEEHNGNVYAFGSYSNGDNHLFIGKLNDFSDFISVSDNKTHNNQDISFAAVNNNLIINSKINSRVEYIIYNYMGQVLIEGEKLLIVGENIIDMENMTGSCFVNFQLGNEYFSYKYIGR